METELLHTCTDDILCLYFMQVLDLNDNQLGWITNHLGHTLDVHRMHYRMTSDIIERVHVAKLLLMQDTGTVGKFANRALDEIQMEGTERYYVFTEKLQVLQLP